MVIHHPRPAVPHGHPDPLPHLCVVAVDRAAAAEALRLHERAAVDPRLSVLYELTARRAQPIVAVLLSLAVDPDHLLDDVLLFLSPVHLSSPSIPSATEDTPFDFFSPVPRLASAIVLKFPIELYIHHE